MKFSLLALLVLTTIAHIEVNEGCKSVGSSPKFAIKAGHPRMLVLSPKDIPEDMADETEQGITELVCAYTKYTYIL